MPRDLKDFPRPPGDNGRGLHGSATSGWSGGSEGLDYWIGELVALGCKWFKVVDQGGDSLPLCERLIDAGIFPIVRVVRKDPPPMDVPGPNPGHIGSAEEQTIRRLIGIGVHYFETNNEPDREDQWKHKAMPADESESAKLVALNWLFDARVILEAGGFPGLPAVSVGGSMDIMGALAALGRQDIMLEGPWIAIHNYCLNHPLAYPDDPVNRVGQILGPQQYDQGPYTAWAWWDNAQGSADPQDLVNNMRGSLKKPMQTILQDHACFREFEYYNQLAVKYVGRPIPILSTEGGFLVGRRQDSRYARVTPEMHRDQTAAMFDFMQRQAPDYYFVCMPWLLLESPGHETDGWYSSFWKRAFKEGTDGRNGIPAMPVNGVFLGEHLPVIDAIKSMPNVARRIPGAPPGPAVQPSAPVSINPVAVPTPPSARPTTTNQPAQTGAKSSSPNPVPPPAPPPLKYAVRSGDTIPKIALRFGTTWQAIAELNKLKNNSTIRPGQVLLIPNIPEQHVHGNKGTHADRSADSADQMENFPNWPPVPEPIPTSKPSSPPILSEPTPKAPASSDTDETPWPLPPAPIVMTPISIQPIQPPAPPVSTKSAEVADPTVTPTLDWDLRLDALNIRVEPARVPPMQKYWKLIRAEYLGPHESNGKHHIYFAIEDEQGNPVEAQRVWQGWPDDKTDATTDSKGEASIPLWASYSPEHSERGPYSAWVDGLLSDRVSGLGLPQKRQVCFVLTWRRAQANSH